MNGVIQGVTERETTLTSNTASLPFEQTDLRTRSAMNCCGFVNHNQGSALFSILDGGVYEVTFNANVTSATAGDWENISFDKKIRVCNKGTVNLAITSLPTTTFSGTGTPVITDTQIPIVKNANFAIERLA